MTTIKSETCTMYLRGSALLGVHFCVRDLYGTVARTLQADILCSCKGHSGTDPVPKRGTIIVFSGLMRNNKVTSELPKHLLKTSTVQVKFRIYRSSADSTF
ncbi:hypothetical protein GOBAR_DD10659 [Gossypium barbadense]|nr:hypothetical protein GOBAR_DD10659 [Gossypium barbadense]